MSHIVQIQARLRDAAALSAACVRLGLPPPSHGTAQLFSAQATGWIVQLPGWHYPIVVDTNAGDVQFDNYEGQWGSRSELDRLLQGYVVERAKSEARRAGHAVTEQSLTDGSIKLTIAVGASAAGGAI